jgi:hypothetical protein
MQAFTDLVGTATLPAHAFDIAELTDLTPALDTAAVDHGLSVEASEASGTRYQAFTGDCGTLAVVGCRPAAERPTGINH